MPAFPSSKNELLQNTFELSFSGNTQSFYALLTTNYTDVFSFVKMHFETDSIAVYDPVDVMWTYYADDWLWHLKKIQADDAWDITRGDPDVVIAILDTDIDVDHPDLTTELLLPYDPKTLDNFDCDPFHYHGTAVSSFATGETTEQGSTPNGQLASVGFNTKFIFYHAFVSDAEYLQKAHHASLDMGADVLTSSAGGWDCNKDPDDIEKALVKEILDNGTVIVMPAGNGFNGTHCDKGNDGILDPWFPLHPIYDDRIIIVTSTDIDDKHGVFVGGTDYTHSHFESVDICCPGYDVFGAKPTECGVVSWPYNGGLSGTSFATPIVAGVCSLLKSINQDFTPGEIQYFIKSTADPVTDASSYPGIIGTGRINAYKAVEKANNCSPIIIDVDTPWNNDMIVVCGVEVQNGATLTISSEIKLSKHSPIIIKPGGKLIVNNNGILTSLDNKLWPGIQVWGDKSAHQFPDSNGDYQQGIVELNPGTIIENALIAIDLWEPDNYASTGGIAHANGATFRNNHKSIHALSYTNYHPVSGQESDNNSNFKNCTFEITEEYLDSEIFHKHVDLAYIRGLDFISCDFSLDENADNVSNYNHAIAGYNAGFRVYATCNSQQSPCPESDYDRSTFTGFYSAIHGTKTTESVATISVNRADFNNNSYGVKVNDINNASILLSEFYISAFENCGHGIYTENVTGFAIEENYFTKYSAASHANYFGISINNSRAVNDIYKNDFNGLSYANFAGGVNWEEDYEFGLEYQCNTNTNNYSDFFVEDYTLENPTGIQQSQGSAELMTGNSFSLTDATWHFYNGADYRVNYFTDVTNTPQTPELRHDVDLQVSETENQCPPHYSGGSGTILSMTPSEKADAEQTYYNNLIDYNSTKTLYDSYVDGGDTDSEISDIQNAQPEDMWALRTQLLGDSPHLSFEVLKEAADKTDVLTESALFDILAANPDELKKDTLISYLENKEDPLPDYMISLLQQVASGSTYKTALQIQMADYKHAYNQAANDIIRSILNDTIIDYTELRNWLDNIGGISSDEQIISSYIAQGNFTDALALANMLPGLYSLKGNDSIEHSFYIDMLNLYHGLYQQGRNTFQLDSTEKAIVSNIASLSYGTAGNQAKNILEAVYNEYCHTCPNVDSTNGYKNIETTNPNRLGEYLGLNITVKPNPARDWASFEYTLINEITEGTIEIRNASGIVIDILNVGSNKGQKLWDIRNIKQGLYIYTIRCNSFSKSGKLIISK